MATAKLKTNVDEDRLQIIENATAMEWKNKRFYSPELLEKYFHDILDSLAVNNLSPEDISLIDRAYHVAQEAHNGQFRDEGAPYIIHPLSVALILAEMHLDPPTIAGALLHDVAEDTSITIEDIQREFGDEVAKLVHGVTKMKKLPTDYTSGMGKASRSSKGSDQQAEYLRQMFMAMGNDVRVILIKLADRLDNMRTLGALPPERQEKNAKETMDIFAPLANRLGIGKIKWQLEDLSFRYLEPQRYKEIASKLATRRTDREAYMSDLTEKLESALHAHGVKAEVYGRPKHIYSIHRKMDKKGLDFDEVMDVRALRVIVADVPTCYQVLGVIHSTWRPVPGEFDDYIAAPKENGYQSLHTAVRDENGKILEVQIRTADMHEDAEYGIAAHWKYKENRRHNDVQFEQRISYMRRLLENAQEVSDAQEFMEVMKQSITDDRVYVFTPRSDIIDLPAGATPIDFAYHIHTEVGNRCRGAKVNGKLVGLDYKLKTGEKVEIVTTSRGGPSLDWLNEDLGYVATHRARQKIRQWFRKRDREKNISSGRESLDRELRRLGMDDINRNEIAEKTHYNSVDQMLEAVGYGDITAVSLISRFVELDRLEQEIKRDELVPTRSSIPQTSTTDRGVDITGTGGLLVKLATCCSPAQGDEIIGFITRGSGVTIHRIDCKNVRNTTEPERLIKVSWGQPRAQFYSVPIEIKALDRSGLMRDIGAVIAAENISMTNVNITTIDSIATFSLEMEVQDVSHLSRVLNKLDQMPEVLEVRRLNM